MIYVQRQGVVGTVTFSGDAAYDIDGDILSLDRLGTPADGSVALHNGLVVYTPEDGFVGVDSFTFTVGDGHGAETTATSLVTVTDPSPTSSLGALDSRQFDLPYVAAHHMWAEDRIFFA